MFTMCNATLMHAEILPLRDDIDLNNDGMIKLGNVYYQTEPILSIFFERNLIKDNSSFYSHILSPCVLFLLKTFCKSPSLSVNGIFLHVMMLLCWVKFCYDLVRWSVEMIRAKNYKTVTKFVKVMPRILWPHFFPNTLYNNDSRQLSDVSMLLPRKRHT